MDLRYVLRGEVVLSSLTPGPGAGHDLVEAENPAPFFRYAKFRAERQPSTRRIDQQAPQSILAASSRQKPRGRAQAAVVRPPRAAVASRGLRGPKRRTARPASSFSYPDSCYVWRRGEEGPRTVRLIDADGIRAQVPSPAACRSGSTSVVHRALTSPR